MLLLLLAAATLAASAEDEVRAAEKAWADAVKVRDFAALERIYTDQLVYAHATGAIENKSEYLGRLRSGAQRYDGVDQESVTIRTYGNSAVAHSKMRMRGTSNGSPFDDHVMMLHLWVKRDGRWQLAAHQTTKLP
jgi:ketosteroid isomerase-like protein